MNILHLVISYCPFYVNFNEFWFDWWLILQMEMKMKRNAAQIVFLAEQMSGSAFFEHPVRQKTQCCNVEWNIIFCRFGISPCDENTAKTSHFSFSFTLPAAFYQRHCLIKQRNHWRWFIDGICWRSRSFHNNRSPQRNEERFAEERIPNKNPSRDQLAARKSGSFHLDWIGFARQVCQEHQQLLPAQPWVSGLWHLERFTTKWTNPPIWHLYF